MDQDIRLIGIDFGDVNIGLAFGSNGLTMPLPSVPGKNLENSFNQILRLAYENKVRKIVVGLPVLADGGSSEQTFKTKDFVKKLKLRTKIPIEMVNEFMTTKEVLEKAVGYGSSKKLKGKLDSLSAEI